MLWSVIMLALWELLEAVRRWWRLGPSKAWPKDRGYD